MMYLPDRNQTIGILPFIVCRPICKPLGNNLLDTGFQYGPFCGAKSAILRANRSHFTTQYS
ncbi:hypothetical protein [Segatella maculosa]|uniref:hypothetical protein n=1 Tax=Segatella maculosa TaxID=439703 RepID=UPI0023F43422|nr:hypothetical protein [Segatella maculosa]